MQSVDWHDFTVVETIEFNPDEDAGLPAPLADEDLRALTRAVVQEFTEVRAVPPDVRTIRRCSFFFSVSRFDAHIS
jgi:hypothetical protein